MRRSGSFDARSLEGADLRSHRAPDGVGTLAGPQAAAVLGDGCLDRRDPVADRPRSRAAVARAAALFEEHARVVLGLCRLLLRDEDEAEDAAQQAFLSAYRSLLRGVEPRDPAPWLLVIARNECRTRIRKQLDAPLPLAAETESRLPDPADVSAERAELAALKAAIAELPDRQREALVLREFCGLSYEEVALAMSVPSPVAVESLLSRARRRLRERIRGVPRPVRGACAVPLALRRELGGTGFDHSGAGLGVAAGAGAAGGLAKLASAPLAAKLATATLAATAVGLPVHDDLGSLLHRSQPTVAAAGATSTGTSPGDDGAPALARRGSEEEKRGGAAVSLRFTRAAAASASSREDLPDAAPPVDESSQPGPPPAGAGPDSGPAGSGAPDGEDSDDTKGSPAASVEHDDSHEGDRDGEHGLSSSGEQKGSSDSSGSSESDRSSGSNGPEGSSDASGSGDSGGPSGESDSGDSGEPEESGGSSDSRGPEEPSESSGSGGSDGSSGGSSGPDGPGEPGDSDDSDGSSPPEDGDEEPES